MKNNCIGCAYQVFDCELGVKKECKKGYEYYYDEDICGYIGIDCKPKYRDCYLQEGIFHRPAP